MAAWFIHKVRSRLLKRNKNWLCAICGATASGKSYAAMRIALGIDPSFNIVRIVFTAEEFMKLINSGTLRRGDIILWDECGVEMSAREWYSISNKAINYVLQTFRFMNIGVIFTVPDIKFVDSQARKLFHTFIECLHINEEKEICTVKVKQMQNDPKEGKIYYKYYRKGQYAITRNYIKLPPPELIKLYEVKKRKFAWTLNIDAQEDIKEIKVKAKPKIGVDKIASEIMKNPRPFIKEWAGRKYISSHKIATQFGVGRDYSMRAKEIAEERLNLETLIPHTAQ